MATPSFNRSKTAASFIAERKLQPPMWEWTPFLLGLPIEVLELIFSNFEFQLPGEAHTENDSLHTTELLRKRISLKDPHPFNTLAATSRSMRDGIEDCCEHLLEMYRKNTCNKCPSTDEKSASLNLDAFNELAGAGKADEDEAPIQAVRTSVTQRGIWLRHIAHSCAFCGSTTIETECAPFNRLIRTCAPCEREQWPNKILLKAAMEKLSLHHILWPPQGYALQWAKYHPSVNGRRYWSEVSDVLLDNEVEAVAKAIKDDPIRHTPTWAMYDLTAEFTKRLPCEIEAEESQDADDIDFELDV
ncbi:hypothetical protein BLS_008258 [Venturia inaequalis]|uniref:Uncharacterized protein n=1 Tax=Venturia inaequalis TaxID=5025 RepID=A0A8H3U9A2_VENIN|nr:hypothetical protein BLS_008258 [Venturia inaequalis]KAE9993827.1 hypothetical protein EG327_003077 [Venturia inaequalis]RDI81000.1 hypothetical protein Vi05172_g8907 [Venturia inaequalis]